MLRFHGDIRRLLDPGSRHGVRTPRAERLRARETGLVRYPALRSASLKDAIEALGIPHTEIGSLRIDGVEVDFRHPLTAGTTCDVFAQPMPEDVTAPSLLRPEPFSGVLFVVDVNVARLGTLLRLLGLDAAPPPDGDDAAIAALAARERRIVLTRDTALLKRKAVIRGRLLRAAAPEDQLAEVLDHFGIHGPFAPFSRCLRCNVPLAPVPKADVLHRLEPLTRIHYDSFHICPRCERVYWPGSHHEAMLARLSRLGLLRSED
nr:Mut7-C ubiquitin/RNAse domain-containing protein [Desulfobaculum xiamenense]